MLEPKRAKNVKDNVLSAQKLIIRKNTSIKCLWNEETISSIKSKAGKKNELTVNIDLFRNVQRVMEN